MISKNEIEKTKLCHINRKLSYSETIEFYEHGFDIIKEKRERKIIQKVASNFFISYSRYADSNEFILSFKNPFYYIYSKTVMVAEIGRFIEKAIVRLNQKSSSERFMLQRRLFSRHHSFSKKETLFEHIIHSICTALRYSNKKIVVKMNYISSNSVEIEILLEMNKELVSRYRIERK